MTRPRLPLQAQEGQPGTHSACPSRRRGGDCGRELFKRTDAGAPRPTLRPFCAIRPLHRPSPSSNCQVFKWGIEPLNVTRPGPLVRLQVCHGVTASLRRVCALSANPPPPPGILSTTPELTTTGPQHGTTCTVAAGPQSKVQLVLQSYLRHARVNGVRGRWRGRVAGRGRTRAARSSVYVAGRMPRC